MAERARVSPYNLLPEAVANTALPSRVTINDCTLREGEQFGDVTLDPKQRLNLAELLDDAGVGMIQVGFAETEPRARSQQRALIGTLRRARSEVMVVGFAANWASQVRAAAESGAHQIQVIYRSSPYLRQLLGVSVSDMLRAVRQTVAAAAETGLRVTFCPTDGTRTEPEVLRGACEEAAAAGAGALCVADTVGVAAPRAVAHLVRNFRLWTGLPVAVHCHNDFGLAVANAVAGVEAGAEIVDTCVNGLGDRTGNPPLDEIVVALEFLYAIPTGVDTTKLTALSQALCSLTGIAVSPNKPVVGPYAFAHKLEIHVREVERDPLAYQAILPELVGNRQQILVGRHSGPFAVRARLRLLGRPVDSDEILAAIVQKARDTARALGRSLTDSEVMGLVDSVSS